MKNVSLLERLMTYAPPGDPRECWEWTRARGTGGYGYIALGTNKNARAHVVAWELHNKQKVPLGMLICHTCDNPPCVNPAHLRLGTHADNTRDKVSRNRQARGEIGNSKLTTRDVLAIRDALTKGATTRSLADEYGVTTAAIRSIKSRRTWRHIN